MKHMANKTPVVALGGISLLRPVSLLPVPIIVVEADRSNLVFHSRLYEKSFVMSELRSSPGSVVAPLIEIAKKSPTPPILFYGNDATMMLASRYRSELHNHYKYLMPEVEIVEACVDKELFSNLSEKYNLPVPKSYKIQELFLSVQKGKIPRFPLALKPFMVSGRKIMKDLSGGHPQKMLLINNEEEFSTVYKRLGEEAKNFIVQEYVHGGEDNVFSFHAYVDEFSNPLGWYVGKKIRTYPSVGGYSSFITLVEDSNVVRFGFDIIKNLKIRGPVKLDFKKDATRGEYFLLEINLRYNLWNYLGAQCGINLAEIAYKHWNGLSYEQPDSYRTDVRWLSFRYDFKTVQKSYWPSGELTVLSWIRSLVGKNVYQVFSWRDPMPFVVSVFRHGSRLLIWVFRLGRSSR